MYAVMIGVGLLSAIVLLEIYYRIRKGNRLLLSAWEINGMVAVIIGFLFAVLTQNLYDFISHPSSYTWSWGMTFYGGIIGGVTSFLLGYFLIIRKKWGPVIKDLLIIAPACIAVAHAWGRVGCFFDGCCYGIETTAWYGVKFPNLPTPVIPTNLFEAIFLFVVAAGLFLMAILVSNRFNFPIYMIAYGIWRFTIEFFRGDYRGEFIPGLSPSQFWSILLVLGGIGYGLFLYFYPKHKQKKEA